MLHILYIIINFSCPRKKIKKLANVMQPLTGPNIYGVNRRSENFSFCRVYFCVRKVYQKQPAVEHLTVWLVCFIEPNKQWVYKSSNTCIKFIYALYHIC